ncbi:response regulator transcription factor [Paraburkholderia bannensis]|uniref:response regulator transcription factor n=1 Tax=Paraburkholderia bannensis TaxID=765414 RepID=UPI002AB698BE|nr:response regulator [Paraburkholderia bannensis]
MNEDLRHLRAEGNIHVIESDAFARASIVTRLRRAGYRATQYASISEFLVRETSDEYGCILTEVHLGEGPGGFALLRAISRNPHPLPIVFMTASRNVRIAVNAMKLGASDYLGKPLDSLLLHSALDRALELDKQRLSSPVDVLPIVLKGREEIVLRGLAAGLCSREIAEQLQLSERTIKSSRASLMRRFSATSTADLLQRAAQLVDPKWQR